MNRRRALAALLLSAATVVTLALPAGAAVPKRSADATTSCGDGQTARVWWQFLATSADPDNPDLSELAAKNPCQQWLVLTWYRLSQTNPGMYAYYVAPGAHFNWTTKHNPHPFGPVAPFGGPSGPQLSLVGNSSACGKVPPDELDNPYGYSVAGFIVRSYKDATPCAH